jgi:hypothetical protein
LKRKLATFLPHLILFAFSLSVMYPVLHHPHWGMFSDCSQVVSLCRALYANHDPAAWMAAINHNYRPGFDAPNVMIWWLSPDNPIWYYALRCVFFSITLSLTYLNSYRLTKSLPISLGSAILWLCVYPTYEVIYTLDKGEIYIGLLFALIVFIQLSVTEQIIRNSVSSRQIIGYASAALVATIYLIFTKTTGQLVLPYGVLLFAVSFASINFPWTDTSVRFNSTAANRDTKTERFWDERKWASLLLLVCTFSWVSYQVFYVLTGGLNYHYGRVIYDASFLCTQLYAYLQGVPDIFILLAISAAGTLITIVANTNVENFHILRFKNAACLLATVCGGIISLCAWNGQLVYSLYPLFAFLLPCLAYALLPWRRVHRFLPIAVYVALIFFMAPARFFDAQSQLKMDQVYNQLVEKLAKESEIVSGKSSVVFPFRSQGSVEVGESTHLATALKLSLDEGKPASEFLQSLKFAPLIRYCIHKSWLNGQQENEEKIVCLPTHSEGPELDKISYVNAAEHHWLAEKIRIGDIILVPYGNVPAHYMFYRGVSLFSTPWEDRVACLPGLKLKEQFRVSALVKRVDGKSMTIGWIALKVEQSPEFSYDLQETGWLANDSPINFGQELQGKILLLQCEKTPLGVLTVKSRNIVSHVPASHGKDSDDFKIPLSGPESLQIYTEAGHHPKMLVKVKEATLIQ